MTSLVAEHIAIAGRLNPTSLAVRGGEMVALIGPNGGGKTSLLRALARIEGAEGRVTIDGEDLDGAPLPRRRRLLSFLPASRDISWPIAVRSVIALGLDVRDEERVEELIGLMELGEMADRPVNRLSTGERARVLAARALASRPRVLLLDEPLSNLDPYWVLRFLDIFRDAARGGQAVLVALHDLSLLGHFDRALLVSEGTLKMDEAPAGMVANERFEQIFRVRPADGAWQVSPLAGQQSSP
ncbi:MAG: ABC transporter ATP-binding protein [Sphingomonas sp.]|nr:ABC transporter ATP-binding protein [Sphingomonas sp.]